MLLLTSTSDKIQVITDSALSVGVHASWVDNASGTITPGRTNTSIISATTTDVVSPPSSSTQRNVQTLNIRNNDGSSSVFVQVQHTDGSITIKLIGYTLGAGETLQYIDGQGWKILDASGQILQSPNQSPAGIVPIGGIILWSGLIATIPTDWALCNGVSNSPGPDLRDKFVVCATQDDAGVAKTNIEGSLKQTGGVTGHLHSAHGNLSHSGGVVGDHTGLTHGLSISDHPDLTHVALSHPSSTLSHPTITIPSGTHTHDGITHADHSATTPSHTHDGITHADHSVASFTGTHASASFSVPSQTHSHASHVATWGSLTLSLSSTGTARTIATGSTGTGGTSLTGTDASMTGTVASGTHTHAAATLTHPSHPSFSAAGNAFTLTHPSHVSFSGTHAEKTAAIADHSVASLSHEGIGTHKGTDYGVHGFTPPAAHGTAGTLSHSFTQPDQHNISVHDTTLSLPNYYAVAFIQRMA